MSIQDTELRNLYFCIRNILDTTRDAKEAVQNLNNSDEDSTIPTPEEIEELSRIAEIAKSSSLAYIFVHNLHVTNINAYILNFIRTLESMLAHIESLDSIFEYTQHMEPETERLERKRKSIVFITTAYKILIKQPVEDQTLEEYKTETTLCGRNLLHFAVLSKNINVLDKLRSFYTSEQLKFFSESKTHDHRYGYVSLLTIAKYTNVNFDSIMK